jgi:hypothetical protein
MKAGEAYTIPAAIDIAKPRPVQKFADKPVEAKLVPSLVIVGWSESLSLLSNDFPTIILHNYISASKILVIKIKTINFDIGAYTLNYSLVVI